MTTVTVNHGWLRHRREALGLTQEQLAERIGVHVNSLNRWEAGEYRPGSVNLHAWEQALTDAEEAMLAHLVDTAARRAS